MGALLTMIFSLFVIAQLGVFSILYKEQQAVNYQLQLDQCVAKRALELKVFVDFIEEQNENIKALRKAAAILSIIPPTKPAGEAAKNATIVLKFAQDGLITSFKLSTLAFKLSPCGLKKSAFSQAYGVHPDFSFDRQMDDSNGAHPAILDGGSFCKGEFKSLEMSAKSVPFFGIQRQSIAQVQCTGRQVAGGLNKVIGGFGFDAVTFILNGGLSDLLSLNEEKDEKKPSDRWIPRFVSKSGQSQDGVESGLDPSNSSGSDVIGGSLDDWL